MFFALIAIHEGVRQVSLHPARQYDVYELEVMAYQNELHIVETVFLDEQYHLLALGLSNGKQVYFY